MIEVLVKLRHKSTTVKMYHLWDVSPENIVGWDCTKEDIGKYILFDDGSKLLSKIKNCNNMAVRTDVGTFRRADIVHCSIPKWPGANYSGVEKGRESFKVRPPSTREKRNASKILNNTLQEGFTVSAREKALAVEKLQTEIATHGITEEWIVTKLKRMGGDINNRHAMEAIKVLARIAGIELNQPRVQGAGGGIALFQQINQGGNTIQQQRRNAGEIPNLKSLRKIIETAKQGAETVEVEIEPR